MRRRRRRSGFSRESWFSGRTRVATLALGAALVLGGFWYLQTRADQIEPERAEVRIPLPDAFKDAARPGP
ncbi:MAG: hypothetical protein GC189_06825 [Alphaproteobacteria bacterium]|nr:hypothetical protein [Alphaproteobacteria bacterium]